MQYSSVDYMLVMSVATAIVSDQIYFSSVSLSAEFTVARRRLSLVRAAIELAVITTCIATLIVTLPPPLPACGTVLEPL